MSNRISIDIEEGLSSFSWKSNVEPFILKILERLGITNWELSVLFCSDTLIESLNKQYRDIDAPTDVLSFEQGDEYIDDEDITWYCAGDIVISINSLKSNALEFDVPIDEELKRLLIHGILHLNGMDHADNSPEQEMLQFQEYLLTSFAQEVVYKE